VEIQLTVLRSFFSDSGVFGSRKTGCTSTTFSSTESIKANLFVLYCIRFSLFFFWAGCNPDKDEMMWMQAFICELAHKEGDADTASKTRSYAEQKRFYWFSSYYQHRILLVSQFLHSFLINQRCSGEHSS